MFWKKLSIFCSKCKNKDEKKIKKEESIEILKMFNFCWKLNVCLKIYNYFGNMSK